MKKVFSVVINVLAVVGFFVMAYWCFKFDEKNYCSNHSISKVK